jgi:hypothetical protein
MFDPNRRTKNHIVEDLRAQIQGDKLALRRLLNEALPDAEGEASSRAPRLTRIFQAFS